MHHHHHQLDPSTSSKHSVKFVSICLLMICISRDRSTLDLFIIITDYLKSTEESQVMAILMNPLAKKVKLLRFLRFAKEEVTVYSMINIVKKIQEYVKKSSYSLKERFLSHIQVVIDTIEYQ